MYLNTLPVRFQFDEVLLSSSRLFFFFFYIIGATLLGLFFYQVSFYTVHKLLTLGGVEVFSQIISCIVPDPAGVKSILVLKETRLRRQGYNYRNSWECVL